MRVSEIIQIARESGVRLGVDGTDLILDADREPAPKVLDVLRRHKAGIVALLTASESGWTAEDWRAFFDERAGRAEFDIGLPREEAEALASECCVVEWLNRHQEPSDPACCAWCRKPDRDGHAVVPFGTESKRHTWLHPECWSVWYQSQRERAQKALAHYGLDAPATRRAGPADTNGSA